MSLDHDARHKTQIIATVLSVLMPHMAFAADWNLSPSLSLVETYTDNVTLSADNTPAESQWITQVNPGATLTGKGRELDLTLAYRMQNVFYLGNGNRNNTYHQLDGRANTDLIPKFLGVDASASLSQQIINPDEKITNNNLSVVNGRQDVLTTSISPYIDTNITKFVHANIRATQDRIIYKDVQYADSTANQYGLQLSSISRGSDWSWRFRVNKQETSYQATSTTTNQPNEKRRDAVLNLGYQVSTKVRLTAQGGYEDNDYQYSAESEKPKSAYWSAGAIWTPDPRTALSVGGGERFFGKTKSFSLYHQGRRNDLLMGYSESLSSNKVLLTTFKDDFIPAGTELPFNPYTRENVSTILTEDIHIIVPYLTPGLEIFIIRSATINWSYRAKKSTATLTAARSRMEFQLTRLEETLNTAGLGWDYTLTRLGTFKANISYQNNESITGNDTFRSSSLRLTRKLGRHVSSSFEVLHNRRTTDVTTDANDYSENQLSASLNMKW